MRDEATFRVKSGLAEMLKGGVIMDVVTPEQAVIAEEAGAAAVMALERVPADIRRDGGVARMSDPEMIAGIQEAVSIPVMAKARIGHFMEARVLEALEVDYVDESEVLTPGRRAQPHRQVGVQGAVRVRRDEPRRGAAADRRGRGDDPLQGRGGHRRHRRGGAPHARDHRRDPPPDDARSRRARRRRQGARARRSSSCARSPRDGRLPVVLFCAGGIATPADAALMMALGAEGVFVGSGIFKSEDPPDARARDRRGDHALAGRRARRARPRAASARRWTASRPRSSRTSSSSPSAAGSDRGRAVELGAERARVAAGAPLVGRARAAGRLRGARARAARLGASVREVRVPADLDGLGRARDPGRRVDHDDARHRARGTGRAAARARAQRCARARLVRGPDHARPRPPRR